MSPPTEAQLECERLREELSVVNDKLRESEHMGDGLEETIVELTEDLRKMTAERDGGLQVLFDAGVATGEMMRSYASLPSPAKYAELMEACEAASEYLRDTPGVDLSLIGPVSVMQTAIAAFGPPFVTRAPGGIVDTLSVEANALCDAAGIPPEPTQEPDDES